MKRIHAHIAIGKWVGLFAAAMTIVAEAASPWFAAYVMGPRHALVWIGLGFVKFDWTPDQSFMPRSIRWHRIDDGAGQIYWWFFMSSPHEFAVPLWVFTIAVLVPTLALWKADWKLNRQEPGRCARCGYDLSGLELGAVCPECAGAPSSHAKTTPNLK